jgi:hypothetical protein
MHLYDSRPFGCEKVKVKGASSVPFWCLHVVISLLVVVESDHNSDKPLVNSRNLIDRQGVRFHYTRTASVGSTYILGRTCNRYIRTDSVCSKD